MILKRTKAIRSAYQVATDASNPAQHGIQRPLEAMAITYRIDAGVIYSRFEGEITLEMLYDYSKRLRADPAFRPGLVEVAEVIDLRHQIRYQDLSNFTSWFDGIEPIHKMAIVARDEMGYGMARMFSQISDSEHSEIQVFRDMKSALSWLSMETGDEA